MSPVSSRPSSVAMACRAVRPLLMILALFALEAQAQPLLGFDEALRLAQERSHQLPAQDAAASAAREMAVAAAQLPDPTIKAGITNLPIDGTDRFSLTRDFMTMRSIGVMQELTRGDKRRARSARFEREAEVALAGRAMALANLQRDTAMAWLERYYREHMRELMRAQRDEALRQVEAADAAYRGGRGAQADLFAARSAVAQMDDRLQQIDLEVATATTRLARWVGERAGQALGPTPDQANLWLAFADLETRLEDHPQIALMARQEAAVRADADLAQANRRSDWSVELMFSQRGPAYSNMVSINLAIPWQWDRKDRQDRELSAKQATAEQVRLQREEALREVVAGVRSALQAWQSNRKRLDRYEATLIPLAAERVQAALAAYRGGTGPLGAVLEARRTDIDTRLERLRIEMDNAVLWAQINYLIPTPTEAQGPKEP